jgi:serine/threonine-protein kinase
MVDPNETAAGTRAPGTPAQQWGAGSVVGDGRYRLTGRLGRGGMAEVFAAEDVRLGRIVAVKLLRGDLAEDDVAKARFNREAQAVAGLNHHAVVAVYDSGEDRTPAGPAPYIVMELVKGHTIKDLLAGGAPPPVDQALLIVSGVLDALAYSHQNGIVHRDIKPANVIITTDGAVKVMDFGIARALHGAASTMTQTGMVMGTPQYLSPEQALGKPVDHRSDLYATGCLLYELLALRPPFVGETPLSVVYQHVQDEPVPPSQINDRVPPELDGLVLRALAKLPDDRFQTADEMRGVLGYAHQTFTQQGGWTGGLWSTGAVTQQVPGPGSAAGYRPDGTSGSTAELKQPLVPGVVGGGAPDSDDAPAEGNRWAKPVLFVTAAVLAVVIGVVLATRGNGDGGTSTDNPPASSSTSQPAAQPSQEQPSDEPSDEPTGDTDEPSSGHSKPSGAPSSSAPTSTPPTSASASPSDATPTGSTKSPTSPPSSATTKPSSDPTTTAPATGGTGDDGGSGDDAGSGGPGGPGGD